MTVSEAKTIINRESIHRINWYNENNLRENQVGIKIQNGYWIVYITDERASIVQDSIVNFDSEEEALDTFIRKARFNKKHYG